VILAALNRIEKAELEKETKANQPPKRARDFCRTSIKRFQARDAFTSVIIGVVLGAVVSHFIFSAVNEPINEECISDCIDEIQADEAHVDENQYDEAYVEERKMPSDKAVDLEPLRYGLTIKTLPENARVRILNITPYYTKGMILRPGDYQVEVSAKGYKTKKEWVTISDRAVMKTIQLDKLDSESEY
jgi:hypothetical protein